MVANGTVVVKNLEGFFSRVFNFFSFRFFSFFNPAFLDFLIKSSKFLKIVREIFF
jgi:hypothetical protein